MLNSADEQIFDSSVAIEYIVPQGKEAVFHRWHDSLVRVAAQYEGFTRTDLCRTSFSFLGPIISAGTAVVAAGGTPESSLSLIFGLCFFGAFIEIVLSCFLHLVRKIISPLVTGTIVCVIGLTLIKTGIISMGGGVVAQKNGTFGSLAKYRRIGDLTATSAVSGEPIKGATYMPRIKGGVLGDGFNSLIAA